MIKGSIHQEYRTITDTYAFNNQVPKYVKQILTELKGEIGNSAIIIGDFKASLSIMARKNRQRSNKEIEDMTL